MADDEIPSAPQAPKTVTMYLCLACGRFEDHELYRHYSRGSGKICRSERMKHITYKRVDEEEKDGGEVVRR